jgi:phosphoglycerate dehydrogenase-like enzyme
MNDKPLVIQTEDLECGPAAWLAQRCELAVCPPGDPGFAELLSRARGLVVRTYTRVDRELLDRAPRLEVVGRAGVALENIDVPACRGRGVEVVHTPHANTRAVVEYATLLILDHLRRRVVLDGPVAGPAWHELRREYFQNPQLSELTLGIWGMGRIGSAMARVGAALDMNVLYNDLAEIPEPGRFGARPVDLDTLLGESDILSLHVDFRESNRHMLGAAALAKVRPTVLIVNTSRGFVVDPGALAEFLRANPGAGALLDVHDPHEPIGPDYPLWGVPNAKLFPHLAAGTTRAKTNMSWVVRDVWRVLSGERPEFPAPGGN